MIDEKVFTTEEIAKIYSSMMDSVNLITTLKAKQNITSEESATITRNIEHIKIMLKKSFWATQDLTPFKNVVK